MRPHHRCYPDNFESNNNHMRDFLFLGLAILFFAVWLFAWLAFHIAGGLIHILLVIGIVALVIHFVRRFSS